MNSMMAFRSPTAARMTRKAKKPGNNVYVPSTSHMPAMNMSYVKNRNESVRNAMNSLTMMASMRNTTLTNNQIEARKIVARKMARGEPVTQFEKVKAGMVKPPKPTGPKPAKGGRNTRRYRKH